MAVPNASIADLQRARRVLLHGVTGSGKSTAARAIGRKLNLKVHLSDEEFGWLPNWTQRPAGEMRRLVGDVVVQPTWVFDTAYSAWRDLVEPRADVIVALDYPRWISLLRLIRRTFARVLDKEPICNGNVETWEQVFSKDSIILWHFRSFKRKRATARAWAERPEGTPVLLLRHPRDLDHVLAVLKTPTL